MIFVDTNIIIDIIEHDPVWRDWSLTQIGYLVGEHTLVVNEIVTAEVAPRIGSLDMFRLELSQIDIGFESLDDTAAFLAGTAFLAYRRKRQGSVSVLPDFFIGGHATARNASILTRDPRFYRTYFPSVPLITPDKAE